jgi:dolichol-phosphate mannosyltransferase
MKTEDVCVLIPALNEEASIGKVVKSYRELGFNNILVVDGHSTDKTVEKARSAGARVVEQPASGKGDAIIYGLSMVDTPYVVMVDGDGTYDAKDISKLLRLLEEGYDHVIGNRLVLFDKKAFTRLNFFGNLILNRLFSMIYGKYLYDVLSGYRAFKTSSIKALQLGKEGFEIEAEMSVESIKKGQKIGAVPVRYYPREMSKTKLNPFVDGLKIGLTIYKLALGHNPLFYFGIMGLVLTLLGTGLGVYIVLEWFKGIEHVPMTILSVALVLTGLQIVIFGVLANLIVGLNRELLNALSELRETTKGRDEDEDSGMG